MNLHKIPNFEFQIQFLKYIQWLLEMSSYTATYKFALLMSLVNVSIESGIQDDRCYFVSYQQLAESFIQLYWSQSLPYSQSSEENETGILRQISKGQIAVINQILALRTIEPNLNKAKISLKEEWRKLVKSVAKTIKDNPAKYLQTPEKNVQSTFLYDYSAHSNGIELKTGIAYCFAHYSVIINKLCQQYWIDFIRKNNHAMFTDKTDLQQFLFGQPRQTLKLFVPLLVDLQDNVCFYCGKKFNANNPTHEVDHFIPWSKYPNDTAHNFVLADRACNNDKRDYLASPIFYEKWRERNQQKGTTINDYALEKNFFTNQEQSEKVGIWAYQMALENRDLVWLPPKNLQKIELTFNPLL